jgi:hypothetical protein
MNTQSIMKKGGRIMLLTLSVLMMCFIALAVMLLVMSPGKPEAYLDESGKHT